MSNASSQIVLHITLDCDFLHTLDEILSSLACNMVRGFEDLINSSRRYESLFTEELEQLSRLSTRRLLQNDAKAAETICAYFTKILDTIATKYHRQVIVLIDEYHSPWEKAYNTQCNVNTVEQFIQQALFLLIKDHPAIFKIILTGVFTRYKRFC